MKSARQAAFEILIKMHRDSAYSNLAIDSKLNECKMNSKDKALVTAIVYGVLERKITLDYVISLHLKQSINKLKPEVLVILRKGAYQILFMDKIPVSAAINESVNLSKKNKCVFASGLINAVLRNISRYEIEFPDYKKDKNFYYSIKYSCPADIVGLWIDSYGEDTAVKIMESSLETAPTVVRVNTLKTTTNELVNIFSEQGISASICKEIENAIVLEKAGSIENIKAYKDGLFHIQDTASQLCCKALNAKGDDVVFDLCAAPGGKSFTICEYMKNDGFVYSFDLYKERVKLIEDGAKRLGVTNLNAKTLDASVFDDSIGFADKVLCDVPCSGLGIIRRKPEIKYKRLEDIDNLPNIQYDILQTASKYVKKGGRLLYSTCSLNLAENDEVCDRFLEENKQFSVVKSLENVNTFNNNSNYLTLMPHINNSDGFFIATFVRTE